MSRSIRDSQPARRAGVCLWLALIALATVAAPVRGADVDDVAEPEGLPAIASADDIITEIRFVGNRITRERILRQEMVIAEGDVADAARIEDSRQAIMDLGLFTSVRAALEPHPEGGRTLVITIKEKFYVVPVPKLNRDDDNNFSLGAELSVDNLAGLNQQLKLRYESENADDTVSGGEVDTWSLSFSYPRVGGSPWTLETSIDRTGAPAELVTGGVVTSLYDKETWAASVLASRWLNVRGPSRGWQVGSGVVWRQNRYAYREGVVTDEFREQNAVGLSAQVQFRDVRDYLYSRSGWQYGYQGEFGEPSIGADQHYTRHEFFYRRYILLPGRSHTNVDVQWKLGLSSGEIFTGEEHAYALGGNKSLRGFDSASFTGNAYTLLNVQYLQPLFGYPSFRGVLFADVGNAYPSNTELHLGDLKWDIGVGLRARVKSLVKIELRMDAAYAPETGEWTYFAGTREMF